MSEDGDFDTPGRFVPDDFFPGFESESNLTEDEIIHTQQRQAEPSPPDHRADHPPPASPFAEINSPNRPSEKDARRSKWSSLLVAVHNTTTARGISPLWELGGSEKFIAKGPASGVGERANIKASPSPREDSGSAAEDADDDGLGLLSLFISPDTYRALASLGKIDLVDSVRHFSQRLVVRTHTTLFEIASQIIEVSERSRFRAADHHADATIHIPGSSSAGKTRVYESNIEWFFLDVLSSVVKSPASFLARALVDVYRLAASALDEKTDACSSSNNSDNVGCRVQFVRPHINQTLCRMAALVVLPHLIHFNHTAWLEPQSSLPSSSRGEGHYFDGHLRVDYFDNFARRELGQFMSEQTTLNSNYFHTPQPRPTSNEGIIPSSVENSSELNMTLGNETANPERSDDDTSNVSTAGNRSDSIEENSPLPKSLLASNMAAGDASVVKAEPPSLLSLPFCYSAADWGTLMASRRDHTAAAVGGGRGVRLGEVGEIRLPSTTEAFSLVVVDMLLYTIIGGAIAASSPQWASQGFLAAWEVVSGIGSAVDASICGALLADNVAEKAPWIHPNTSASSNTSNASTATPQNSTISSSSTSVSSSPSVPQTSPSLIPFAAFRRVFCAKAMGHRELLQKKKRTRGVGGSVEDDGEVAGDEEASFFGGDGAGGNYFSKEGVHLVVSPIANGVLVVVMIVFWIAAYLSHRFSRSNSKVLGRIDVLSSEQRKDFSRIRRERKVAAALEALKARRSEAVETHTTGAQQQPHHHHSSSRTHQHLRSHSSSLPTNSGVFSRELLAASTTPGRGGAGGLDGKGMMPPLAPQSRQPSASGSLITSPFVEGGGVYSRHARYGGSANSGGALTSSAAATPKHTLMSVLLPPTSNGRVAAKEKLPYQRSGSGSASARHSSGIPIPFATAGAGAIVGGRGRGGLSPRRAGARSDTTSFSADDEKDDGGDTATSAGEQAPIVRVGVVALEVRPTKRHVARSLDGDQGFGKLPAHSHSAKPLLPHRLALPLGEASSSRPVSPSHFAQDEYCVDAAGPSTPLQLKKTARGTACGAALFDESPPPRIAAMAKKAKSGYSRGGRQNGGGAQVTTPFDSHEDEEEDTVVVQRGLSSLLESGM